MTKYAAKILEIIAQSRNHMTAEQVLEALRQVYPAVAPATVYNNLNKLWAAGQIRKVSHPHSDIPGSRAICASPELFAAYHVLRRLREPRHPML